MIADKMRPGPWDDEPNHKYFKRQGYHCAILRHTSLGHLCGYVGVPPTHPLYGKDLTMGEPYMDVHGGVTWSEKRLDAKMPEELWYIGFDCAHHNDLSPSKLIKPQEGDIYRTITYVTNQVTKLAKQLKALEK